MIRGAALLALLAGAAPAIAQPLATPEFGVEATSDLRRRGLSWSDGRPALSATASLPVAGPFSLALGAATLRGSRRHGGADLGLDAEARATLDRGPWRLTGGAAWHAFPGGDGRLDYGEVRAGAGLLIGPLQADVAARYAPRQRAIGGDNLHLGLDLSAALPGTPWTLAAGLGRSLGDGNGDGDARAQRLRPARDYTDWRLGVEHVRGPLGVGVTYSDTSIGRVAPGPFADRDVGARLAGHVRVFF